MNKTILIIDDDTVLRNTLVKGLRVAGFSTLSAESAEQGAEVLQKLKADAIILDRMMTGIDGLSFLKGLRASGNNTPVIMLTALSGPENAIDGLSGGANDYLAKPFQLQELILRLNNMIKNSVIEDNNGMPDGLMFMDEEFFIKDSDMQTKLLALSGEEKKLLQQLVTPVGNTVSATPMVAKRLRNKLNGVLSNVDIITIRGIGYKLIKTQITANIKGDLS
ncbi:MAG: response regulator transcription factor [Alphaproteobacteria bacterium]|nr:response regulator transcription factor [Alphaproteobacteria bacterium]MBN2674964.1 response regulator transcription factor [Alphaproteobacteria bacterium]